MNFSKPMGFLPSFCMQRHCSGTVKILAVGRTLPCSLSLNSLSITFLLIHVSSLLQSAKSVVVVYVVVNMVGTEHQTNS
jgi:hypothetical protein